MRFSSSPNRPEAWKEMKLADVCKTFTSGGTPSRKKLEYFENGTIPWVRTKELNDGIITEVEEFITSEALKNSSAVITISVWSLPIQSATILACFRSEDPSNPIENVFKGGCFSCFRFI